MADYFEWVDGLPYSWAATDGREVGDEDMLRKQHGAGCEDAMVDLLDAVAAQVDTGLRQEIAELESLLASMPKRRFIERIGLEGRLEMLRELE